MQNLRIDFAAEGCGWEVAPCPKPGAGLAGEWLGVYCREHLALLLIGKGRHLPREDSPEIRVEQHCSTFG